jgi:hypothetical protein
VYVIRDVFRTRPGRAKDLVRMFKEARAHLLGEGMTQRILTDVVSAYWTVVLETEVRDLSDYFALAENPKIRENMAGYMDLVLEGRREIFKVA